MHSFQRFRVENGKRHHGILHAYLFEVFAVFANEHCEHQIINNRICKDIFERAKSILQIISQSPTKTSMYLSDKCLRLVAGAIFSNERWKT